MSDRSGMLAPDQTLDRPSPKIAEDQTRQPDDLCQRRTGRQAPKQDRKGNKAKPPGRSPKPEPQLSPGRAKAVGVLFGHFGTFQRCLPNGLRADDVTALRHVGRRRKGKPAPARIGQIPPANR